MTVQLPTAEPGPALQDRPALQNQPSNAGDGTTSGAGVSRRASSASTTTGWRLSPRLRKTLVAAHILIGVGWFGITLAKLVLEIVSATSGDRDVVRTGYLFMATLDRAVFPPVAIATLITGIVLSLGTAWGLFRHWWIVVKLVLTVGVVVTGVRFVGAWTEQAIAVAAGPGGAAADADLASASSWLIGWAVAHVLMLGAATVISVFKPWGRIRPDQQERARRATPDRRA